VLISRRLLRSQRPISILLQILLKNTTARNSAKLPILLPICIKKRARFIDGRFPERGIRLHAKITAGRFKYFDRKGSAVYLFKGEKNWKYFIVTLNPHNKIDRFVVTDLNYNEELPVVMSKTRMRLPFDSSWFTFRGGDTEDQNCHVTSKAQRNAYDFVIKNEQAKSFKTNGRGNEDYYCFGKPIYAPCDGRIVASIDTVHDNNPGDMNPAQLTGNTLLIQTRRKEYILLAHFKQYGVLVKTGQKIKKGQLIGYCGNSGNSSEPHLHMHVMDGPSLSQATGIKCTFEKLWVNGQLKQSHSPVRGERVVPARK
jgi:hypothetical protein